MKFHILTLFPDMIRNGLHNSITGRAIENHFIEVDAVNIRDFTTQKHGKVDDYTYGGGAGMLMQAEPVYQAWKSVSGGKKPRTIYVTPTGTPFTQEYAGNLAAEEELVFLCGHYEGIDDRVLQEVVTDYISIGDYVLTGGELPAMVMIDAVSRLVPGVLHNENSAQTESFHRNLLEYPQYTRPEVWRDKAIPQVLLGGDHKKIEQWRMEQSISLTRQRRPDLYQRYEAQEKLIQQLSRNKRQTLHMMESISRGKGKILFHEKELAVVYDPENRICMIDTGSMRLYPKQLQLLLDAVPVSLRKMVFDREQLVPFFMENLGLKQGHCYYQACMTQKNALPVKYKKIRPLTMEDLPLLENLFREIPCTGKQWEEMISCVQDGGLFGAFEEEKLLGFAGWYREGRLGPLFVGNAYRGKKIGTSLQSYCLNRQLELGYVPYAQTDNIALLKLYEKLGLYLSRKPLWWLEAESDR